MRTVVVVMGETRWTGVLADNTTFLPSDVLAVLSLKPTLDCFFFADGGGGGAMTKTVVVMGGGTTWTTGVADSTTSSSCDFAVPVGDIPIVGVE